MDMISRNNAKEALYSLKMEITSELSYNYMTYKNYADITQNTLIANYEIEKETDI